MGMGIRRGVLMLSVIVLAACSSRCFFGQFLTRSASAFGSTESVPDRIADPVCPDARLAVLWVGHSTILVQMDDKLILTDPVFRPSVGQLSPRLI